MGVFGENDEALDVLDNSEDAGTQDTQDNLAAEEQVTDQDATDNQDDAPLDAAQDDGQLQEGERLLAGNFKSVEELEKAYTHARRLLSQKADALLGLQDELMQHIQPQQAQPQPQQAQPQQAQPQGDWDAANDAFRQALSRDPMGTLYQLVGHVTGQAIAPLQAQARGQTLVNEYTRIKAEYPDFEAVEADITKMVQTDTALRDMVIQDPRKLELLYKAAKTDKAAQAVAAARAAGRQDAVAAQQARQGAQTAPASARRVAQSSPEEQLMERIFGAPGQSAGIFG